MKNDGFHYRFIFSIPEELKLLTKKGRSPDSCFILLGHLPVRIDQTVVLPFVSIYSCGDSSGFSPDSLFKPFLGTFFVVLLYIVFYVFFKPKYCIY